MNPRAWGRGFLLLAALSLCAGCENDQGLSASANQPDLFAPTAMRVQPVFTKIGDWTQSGKPDGIEAHLEFTDQFGDPTKATGKVLFEVFDYRRDSPDPRGKRVFRWVGSLTTLAEQRERWNTTLRTYRFQLEYPAIQPSQTYVLSAIFERSSGGRFFSQVVLPARPPVKTEKKSPLPGGE